MSSKKAQQRPGAQGKQHTAHQRRSRIRLTPAALISIALLLSLTAGLLAQWRATPVVSRTNVPPAQAGSSPVGLTKEYIYADGKLVATEEPASNSNPLSAPASLTATTASASQLNLNWTASTGPVDHYQIERREENNSYQPLPAAPQTNSFSDTGVSSGKAYLYRVRAVDAAGNVSPYSNVDLATAVTFTDDPLVSATTIIKAQHIVELRQAINAVRALAGLTATAWTDPSPQGVVIKAVHVQEMRTSLDQALTTLEFSLQPYTDSTLSSAITVKRVHFEELRQRVK
jgi:hypothetical protein